MTRFGYLGPEGTFTSMALDAWGPAADGERTAYGSVDPALAALRAGGIDGAPQPAPSLWRVESSLLPHPAEVLVLVLALGVVALLVGGIVVLLRRSGDLRRRVAALEQHRPAGDADLAALRADLRQALRHVAVVRYDAFGDMGGRLSFSAAVIDDHGDGLVFSSIHARGESRTYAKGVVGGTSDATLTPEEQQALAAARTGKETP